MGIGSANPLLLALAAADSDPVTKSLRFNGPDNPRLIRSASDIGTPTDAKKITISMWFKLGDFDNDTTGRKVLLNAINGAGSDYFWIELNADNKLNVTVNNGSGSIQGQYITNRVFRDPTAWIHLCVAVDSTLSTEADRCKIFINGVRETSFSTTNHWPSDWFNEFNEGAYDQYISGWVAPSVGGGTVGDLHWDGLIADVYNIDGAAIEPVGNFIEDTGYNSYKPKAFDMSSYGGNSFHLKFEDSNDIGADSSGNSNDFSASSVSGTYDKLLDTPNKNYATWNPLRPNASMTYAEGNLAAVSSGGSGRSGYSTFGITSGKWYFESLGGDNNFGLRDDGGSFYYIYYNASGSYNINGSTVGSKSTYTTTDIISCAVDFDAETFEFYKNGTGQGQSSFSNTGISALKVEFAGTYSSARTCYANFGQDPTFAGNKTEGQDTSQSEFYYAPPSGFKSLNTSNFDDPTVKAHENFDVEAYGGNGATSYSNWDFQPNLVWIKSRTGGSSGYDHFLFDSVRGSSNRLLTNTNDAETASSGSTFLASFDSDGFSVGNSNSVSNSNLDFVAWGWKENASAGFDIVTWAGNSGSSGSGYSEQSVSHSLGVAPEMIIAKARSDNALSSNYYSKDWAVYHKDLSSGYFVKLNETDSEAQHDGSLFSSIGSSSVSFGNDGYNGQYLNFDISEYYSGSAEDYVAYLFASVDGVCKVGSYTGNGSTDGPMVHCGFRPAFVMAKRSDQTSSWQIWDNGRDIDNVVTHRLRADLTTAEDTGQVDIDFLSNGWKLRNTGINYSSGKYIFLAMAESPLKYANAR